MSHTRLGVRAFPSETHKEADIDSLGRSRVWVGDPDHRVLAARRRIARCIRRRREVRRKRKSSPIKALTLDRRGAVTHVRVASFLGIDAAHIGGGDESRAAGLLVPAGTQGG